MKFLTDEQLISIYLSHPNAIGPMDEALKIMRAVEQATGKEVLANAKDSLKWMNGKEKN